jgi:hypothetical protein
MEKKEFKKRCFRIFRDFDVLNDEGIYLHDFVFGPLKKEVDYLNKRIIEGQQWEKQGKRYSDLIFSLLPDMFFSLGYIMGQLFDPISPQTKKDIEALKKVIKEKSLLPYLPRERKGGSYEKEELVGTQCHGKEENAKKCRRNLEVLRLRSLQAD